MPDISIIVPAYNEDESLPELSQWIDTVMKTNNFSYEVFIIDDGSTDNTWEVIETIHSGNKHIKGIKYQRNYGKSAALNTGFKAATGDVVITMDADLQDSPDEIPGLYSMIMTDGYDLVSGWKKKRHDPIAKTVPSKFFNFVTSKVSGIKLHDFNCGLKAYKNKVIKSIDVYGEMHRYIPVIAKWAGFKKISEKVVQHQERKYGVSKFGLERFIFGFLDLVSITFVSRFKKKPMHFFGTLGTIVILFGLFFFGKLGWEIIQDKWINQVAVRRELTDQPLFYLTLTSLIIGVQLFMAGFLGEMLSLNNPERNEYLIDKRHS
ncbi:MAG: glycosyltransferase family 2 protein [Cyclobacteriaceae bacterium]